MLRRYSRQLSLAGSKTLSPLAAGHGERDYHFSLSDLTAEPDPPTVILNPAPADGAEQLLAYDSVDYLTPNKQQYKALKPALDSFNGELFRKRGCDGITVEAGQRFTVRPPPVEVVDTTGAGDLLNGFMAAQLATGSSRREAIELGTIAASLATRRRGTQRRVPTLGEVRAFQVSWENGA